MSRPRSIESLIGLAVASALLFSIPAHGAEASSTVNLSLANAKRQVRVVVGGGISVRLTAKLGTGYSWHVRPMDGKVVAQDGEPTVEPSSGGKPGAAGGVGGAETQVFRFTAKAPGAVSLSFNYARGFEPGTKPVNKVTFRIRVVPAAKG